MIKKFAYSLSLVALLGSVVACGGATDTADTTTEGGDETAAAPEEGGSDLEGTITVDGSSTVFPISEAMAEEFQDRESGGADHGRRVWYRWRLREVLRWGDSECPMLLVGVKQEEIDKCAENGIEMIEVPVATDALSCRRE
jgi:phosphate transport system substrate-binding protein